MRSYALFLALAVLHARAATIPAPETQKKLPINNDALDNVSLDNNESEQELVDPANTIKDLENNLRNSIPESVPVKVIEEKPIIKTVALKEDSNDYVPDNDDSSNIKRLELDLKNPGPPQRQEHDSQNPVSYNVDRERAVAVIKQSIEESQSIFNSGIRDVTQKFTSFFSNNEDLTEVSKTIQNLRKNFDVELLKLSSNVNSYLKPTAVEVIEGANDVETPSNIKEVENRLKTLETNFNSGIDMLSEGVELLSILKEEDEQNLKISGKADNGNVPEVTGTATGAATGTSPTNPASGSSPTTPAGSNAFTDFMQFFQNTIGQAMTNVGSSFQNFINPGQNTNSSPGTNNTSQGGFNPTNIFQGLTIPNIFQNNQNTQQQPQGTVQAGAQADDASAPERPNILQQIQTTWQNIVSPAQTTQQQTQQNQNPISQFFTDVNQGITNFFQPRPGVQQTIQQSNQPNNVISQPAAAATVEGTNVVPAVPSTQAEPVKPAKEIGPVASESVQVAPVQSTPVQNEPVQAAPVQTAPVQSAPVQAAPVQAAPVQTAPVQAAPAQSAPVQAVPFQNGPIQQIVQNNPIVKGITNAVQRFQGLSNPSKPRDASSDENIDSKGHGGGGANNGDIVSGIDTKSAPVKEHPENISVKQDGGEPVAELNKTE